MQDLLVIHDGDIERLLPLVDVFVTDIDLDARRRHRRSAGGPARDRRRR